MDEVIYFIGWNKRIELRLIGQRLIYNQRNDDGSLIRLSCDMKEKRMVEEKKGRDEDIYTETPQSSIRRGVTLDLGDKGDRWEGDLKNGYPFGYGCLYNAENELLYSGFIYENEKVCFGEEYQNSKIEYSGYYYKNQRHGYGKLYNLCGELIYEGNWCFGGNDKVSSLVVVNNNRSTVLPELDDKYILHTIEKLIIENGFYFEFIELRVVDYPFLKLITVGDKCFEGVEYFEVGNCKKLEKLSIGKNSFLESDRNSKCIIHDCTCLKEITVDVFSFERYGELFELQSMV